MKTRIVSLILFALLTGGVFAQSGAFQEAVSDHYRVFSEVSLTHAQETADMLDAYLELYNGYLHFDTDELPAKLRVRIFANKTNFDSYLASIIPQQRDSFVFLQYKDVAKSELLGYFMDEESFNRSLAHHAFIQFLKAYIPNPPLWMQKGFAVYFEKSSYDAAAQKADFRENLAWVRTLKSIVNGESSVELIDLEDLLTIDVETANENIEAFYAEAWALVSFLHNTDLKEYNRILWDSISTLDPESSIAENGKRIQEAVFAWVTNQQFYADSQDHLASVKTFAELVRDGMAYYGEGEYDRAEKSFLRAIELNESHDIPYYYLGLINYAREEYTLAEYYYLTAQQMGGDLGLTYYALGVNAYANNRFDDAARFLEQAQDADPFAYGEKSQNLLNKIEG